MNVIITEFYDADGPVTWICDVDKASPKLKEIIQEALTDEEKTGEGKYGSCGWQSNGDEVEAVMTPPCKVHNQIYIYFS